MYIHKFICSLISPKVLAIVRQMRYYKKRLNCPLVICYMDYGVTGHTTLNVAPSIEPIDRSLTLYCKTTHYVRYLFRRLICLLDSCFASNQLKLLILSQLMINFIFVRSIHCLSRLHLIRKQKMCSVSVKLMNRKQCLDCTRR